MRWSAGGDQELTLTEATAGEKQQAAVALQALREAGDALAAETGDRLLDGLEAGIIQSRALESLARWCHAPEGPRSLREPAITASQALFGFRLPTPDEAATSTFFWRVARRLDA